jgi:hypothetical protein
MASNGMSAALSVLMMRNFSKNFLRSRRALEFSHGLGQKRTSRPRPKLTFVCFGPKADNAGAIGLSALCQSRPMHRSKQHLYSITSSARASSVGGTARPSILAVWALMTSSNFDACTTGKSAGLTPLRMRAA